MTDQIATATGVEFGDSFMEHRISGYAREDRQRRYFDVPLVTHVAGNLYQGGVVPGVRLPDEFRTVFRLCGGRYGLGPDTVEHKVLLNDSRSQSMEHIEQFAAEVVEALDGGPTLVHCQAGLNRSGLITARALMLWRGYSAAEAINVVRRRSPVCLCNQTFTNWLHGHD